MNKNLYFSNCIHINLYLYLYIYIYIYICKMNDNHFVSHVCKTWKRSVPITKCHPQMFLFLVWASSCLLFVQYNTVTRLSSDYCGYLLFVVPLLHTRWLSLNHLSHLLSPLNFCFDVLNKLDQSKGHKTVFSYNGQNNINATLHSNTVAVHHCMHTLIYREHIQFQHFQYIALFS
jgi:hypothetical protein